MTDKQFLKRMIVLIEKMSDIYSDEPLDQNARQAVLDEVHETGANFIRSRRRRPWFMILVCFLLFCLLYLIVFVIIL